MPDFWQFPTVSMGLAPIMAIYQARFNRYLEDRGLKQTSHEKVWCFMGDGETDEPESLGAITLPAREKLDNLIFVINCNLQRLDGPVRGNGRIIQELETVFRGAGWNVIKVIWGDDWDELLAGDKDGLLVRRMGEVVDGEYQNYVVRGGAYIREHFFGKYPPLLDLVEHLSDEQLVRLRLGGHDPEKIYAAYKAAVEHKGSPSVVIARTIKGYGLGEAGEGKNITHQQKKLNEAELMEFKKRFDIPISDGEVASVPFYRPDENGEVLTYLREKREQLCGYVPERSVRGEPLQPPPAALFEEFDEGSGKLEVSTTMAFVRLLSKLLQDKNIGRLIVPIVPDEARTFGMESLFRQVGIYSHAGQLYEPVDKDNLLYYKEATDGQILEEGITEAGAMSSFIAAGTAYATHGVNTIPLFIYYSMFGFQRIGDLIWAAADMRARGFIVGGTAGRTTLAGEGLQHQDGHSHLLAYPYPTVKAYDPAFAYELAAIIRDGLRRMYHDRESVLYYLTVMNEPYVQPPKGKGIEEGIIKGIYKFKGAENAGGRLRVNLFGSGSILNKVIEAGRLLEEKYGVAADVWSVTSYKELHRDALEAERWNMLHPQEDARIPYIARALSGAPQVCVAASDYVKALPESIGKWIPGRLISLGTDGFGRSDGRAHLRDFFEVDERYITLAALYGLALEGQIDGKRIERAIKQLKIDPDKINPMTG
jgi:pyruvate dehydrogenase E1 component